MNRGGYCCFFYGCLELADVVFELLSEIVVQMLPAKNVKTFKSRILTVINC